MYISLDIDVVDTAHGGQKYPEPGGLSARELLRALRVLSRAHVAGFDLCCLAPRYDLQGHLSQLAARAVLEVIAGIALQRPAPGAVLGRSLSNPRRDAARHSPRRGLEVLVGRPQPTSRHPFYRPPGPILR